MFKEIESSVRKRNPDKELVFGEGAVNAPIMLIGEAPGREEVEKGRPFSGKAGRNLDGFLNVLGISRENIYITNAVKYRPVKISEKGSVSNRTPTVEEVFSERDDLMREIAAVSPKLIVTLGNIPLRSVTGDRRACVGHMHGRLISMDGFRLFPLYHPASIIYNPALIEVYTGDLVRLKIVANSL